MSFADLICGARNLHRSMNFDCFSFGVIDFKRSSFDFYNSSEQFHIYDLASLTKVLTVASVHLDQPDIFDHDMDLLLEHRGGLPATLRLMSSGWKSVLRKFQLVESSTLYSDPSVLLLMLNIEDKIQSTLHEFCKKYWDQDVYFWKDIVKLENAVLTGVRNGKHIQGTVHDNNAFRINEFCSHAGLFGTIEGVCKTLLHLADKYFLIDKMKKEYKFKRGRFLRGWDTVENLDETLAGKGCSLHTFGHLGFTGTSVWIDIEKMRGSVILTNATQGSFYDKSYINAFRRSLGELIWRS